MSNLPVQALLNHKGTCMTCKIPVSLENGDEGVFGCRSCTNVACEEHAVNPPPSESQLWSCPHCAPTSEVTWNYFDMCVQCGCTITDEDKEMDAAIDEEKPAPVAEEWRRFGARAP